MTTFLRNGQHETGHHGTGPMYPRSSGQCVVGGLRTARAEVHGAPDMTGHHRIKGQKSVTHPVFIFKYRIRIRIFLRDVSCGNGQRTDQAEVPLVMIGHLYLKGQRSANHRVISMSKNVTQTLKMSENLKVRVDNMLFFFDKLVPKDML